MTSPKDQSASERRDELAEEYSACGSSEGKTFPEVIPHFKAGYDTAGAQLQMERNMRLDLERSYNEVTARINGENAALAAEVAELKAAGPCRDCAIERDKLRAEVELLRVQLAGCGVAAMCNTEESMREQLIGPGDYGFSASYQDAVNAVKREVAWREQCLKLAEILEGMYIGKYLGAGKIKKALAEFEAFRKERG